MYVTQKGLNSLSWVMLEIKLPREIMKSPLATEMALNCFLQGGGISTKYHRLYKGSLPAYSSLEIASLEGVIHFYIRTQTKFRPIVEANFYAQYPGIEIIEADDYTKLIHYHHLSKDVSMWGAAFRLNKSWKPNDPKTGKPYPSPDPEKKGKDYEMKADFLPIKTYLDYGLEKDPKEEFKVDPLAPLIETMGALGKGEYMWYQILVQDESVYNTKMPKFYVNEATHEHVTLREMADARKKQIRTADHITHGQVAMDPYGRPVVKDEEILTYNIEPDKKTGERLAKAVPKKEMDLTPEDKMELELINKKLSKPLVLCTARALYVAKKQSFVSARINDVLGVPRPFNGSGSGLNTFAPVVTTDPYDYPWQNFRGQRVPWRSEEFFEAFVEREGYFPHIKSRESLDKWEDTFFWTGSMKQRKLFRMIYEAIFHPFEHPFPSEVFALNLEELATMWHLPGATVATPTLPRIDSIKGVAPANLPV